MRRARWCSTRSNLSMDFFARLELFRRKAYSSRRAASAARFGREPAGLSKDRVDGLAVRCITITDLFKQTPEQGQLSTDWTSADERREEKKSQKARKKKCRTGASAASRCPPSATSTQARSALPTTRERHKKAIVSYVVGDSDEERSATQRGASGSGARGGKSARRQETQDEDYSPGTSKYPCGVSRRIRSALVGVLGEDGS